MNRVESKRLFRFNFYPIFISIFFIAISSIGGCGSDGGGESTTPPATSSINRINVDIQDADINPDRKPVVTFRLTDGKGNPLNRNEASINFIIARIEPGHSNYFNYITRVQSSPITSVDAVQASSEGSTGAFEDLGDGVYRYTFEITLPEGYTRNATHTIGIYATRVMGSDTFVSNATFNFVPSGGGGTGIRDIVETQSCNTCHDPLQAHGGSRRDVKLCILCHSSEIEDPDSGEIVEQIDPDTGNNIGFNIMVHKIHMGENLPSVQNGVPYEIIGFRQGVHDYSDVVFPQDIRNCTKCHADIASQHDDYKNDPSRNSCGSCHDDVDFTQAINHPTIQLTDNNCSGCHLPSTGNEFDISVTGAHTVPAKSKELAGVNFSIVNVQSMETGSDRVRPGQHPEVTFRIVNDNGDVINPSDMDSLSLVFSGPTTDYGITPVRENPMEDAVPDGSGNFTYAFNTPVPANATGTYTLGIEGYRIQTVGGQNKILVEDVRDAGRNEVFDFPVADSEAIPRRMVVDTALCSNCHGVFSKDFSIHGSLRNNTEYCVMCHNPSEDDLEVRTIPEGQSTTTTASINFRKMIHKIHTGEELTDKPYIIYGFRSSLHDFSDVRFPGDRRNCETCHLPGTQILDPGKGILGNMILPTVEHQFKLGVGDEKVITNTFTTSPVITVCTSCHDNLGVSQSGNMLTGENHLAGPQPESACIDCHIANDPLGVEEVHIQNLPPSERINRPE